MSDEAQRGQETVRICLQELERCLRATSRPVLLTLVGSRYVWRPPSSSIPAQEFESSRSYIVVQQIAFRLRRASFSTSMRRAD